MREIKRQNLHIIRGKPKNVHITGGKHLLTKILIKYKDVRGI
jgi:predicted ThiF/HesA family dinucleotide-utilizing enzyme